MSTNNPTNGNGCGTDYEQHARDSAAALLSQSRIDAEESMHHIEQLLHSTGNGELTADEIVEIRGALYELEQTLEESVVPLVDGVESYEQSGHYIPYSRIDELAHCDCTEDSE